ncbi:MAG: hypothetical protein IKF71_05220 [Bacilli bacterium]|nr:hypothetical protein [Bacilli bacterium]
MEEFILFILTFLLIFLVYQLIFIRPLKKPASKRKGKEKKELLEIRYLKNRYPLDFDKISYPQLLQICAITSSLDMSIAVTIVTKISSFIWEIVVGFVVVCIMIVVSYHIVYLFYKKKGMIKHGKHK